jgi:hypothetical protein
MHGNHQFHVENLADVTGTAYDLVNRAVTLIGKHNSVFVHGGCRRHRWKYWRACVISVLRVLLRPLCPITHRENAQVSAAKIESPPLPTSVVWQVKSQVQNPDCALASSPLQWH